jgi:hypothetical protein
MPDHPHGQHPEEMPAEAPGGPQEAPSYDLPPPPTPEQAAALENARKALTGFLVVIDVDGTAWATNDINMDLVLERPPMLGDMYRACAEVMKDIETTESAQKTVGLMMQAQQQMAQQLQQDKIARKLAEKGIRVPGR